MKNNKTDTQKNNLTKSIFNKIEKEHIKQVPRWKFILKNYSFWFLVVISIFIAGAAISIIILSFLQMDISVADRASGGIIQHILLYLPYIWILIFLLFIILGLGNFVKTKYGYRHSFIFIIFISTVVSILFGILIYSVGGARRVERYAHRLGSGHYLGSELRREQMWTQANKGLLAGVPLNTLHNDILEFDLIDFRGNTWTIDAHRLEESDKAILAVSGKVAIIGIKNADNVFEACYIVPWERHKNKRILKKEILSFSGSKSLSERNIFELRSNKCS